MKGIKFDEITSKLHFKKYDGFKFDEMTARVPHIFCLNQLQASTKAIASHYSALILPCFFCNVRNTHLRKHVYLGKANSWTLFVGEARVVLRDTRDKQTH